MSSVEPTAGEPATPDGTGETTRPTAPKARRRKPVVMAAAGGVAVLVLLAVLIVWPRGGGEDPEAIVRDYLEAIKDGDVDEALRIAGRPEVDVEHDDAFLTADALSSDWTIEQVVRRYPGQPDPPVVDVTLAAADGSTATGRFTFEEAEDGWQMSSPFATIWDVPRLADFIELNDMALPSVNDAAEPVTYVLFPGVYQAYSSLDGLLDIESATLFAFPEGGIDLFTRTAEPTEAGQQAAQDAVNAHIDACAARPEVAPEGCPFSATDGYSTRANAGEDTFDEPEDLVWQVITYPEVFVDTDINGGLLLITRSPGTIRFSGTGILAYSDDTERRSFDVECGFNLSSLDFDVTPSGTFDFTASEGEASNTCR